MVEGVRLEDAGRLCRNLSVMEYVLRVRWVRRGITVEAKGIEGVERRALTARGAYRRRVSLRRVGDEEPLSAERLGSCGQAPDSLAYRKHVRDLAAFVWSEMLWTRRRPRQHRLKPGSAASCAFRPCAKSIPKRAETVGVVEWDGFHAPMLPESDSGALFAALKGIEPVAGAGPQVQSFEQILHGRIVRSVADEQDLETRQ
jgi:hypothetical protein